jgi:hypothetical protein
MPKLKKPKTSKVKRTKKVKKTAKLKPRKKTAANSSKPVKTVSKKKLRNTKLKQAKKALTKVKAAPKSKITQKPKTQTQVEPKKSKESVKPKKQPKISKPVKKTKPKPSIKPKLEKQAVKAKAQPQPQPQPAKPTVKQTVKPEVKLKAPKENNTHKIFKKVDWVKLFEKIAFVFSHLTVFLTPVFFLPFTPSPLALNKQIFLVAMVFITLFFWFLKMLLENKFQVRKNFLFSAPLFFLLAYLFTSVFSISRERSFFGAITEEQNAFITQIFFVLLFIIIANFYITKKAIVSLILNLFFSSALVFLISLLQFFGVDFFGAHSFSDKNFNTIGELSDLSYYAAFILILSISALLLKKVFSVKEKVFALVAFIFAITIIVLINNHFLWFFILIATLLMSIIGIAKQGSKSSLFFIVPIAVFIFSICAIFIFPNKPIISIEGLNLDINYQRVNTSQSLKVLWNSLKERNLIGVGPGNFDYLFAKNLIQKRDFNNFLDIKNSYINTLYSTGGITVILTHLFILVIFSIQIFRLFVKQKISYSIPFSIVWIFLTLLLFVAHASFVLLLVWWIISAILAAIDKDQTKLVFYQTDRMKKDRYKFTIAFLFVILLFFTVLLSLSFSKRYLSLNYYQKILSYTEENKELDFNYLEQNLQKALQNFDKKEDYYLAVADLYWLGVKELFEEKKGNPDFDNNRLRELAQKQEAFLNKAIEINQYNYRSYLKKGLLYQKTNGVIDDSIKLSLENLEKAQELSPRNPFLNIQMAKVNLISYDFEIINQAKSSEGVIETVSDPARDNLERAKQNLIQALELDSRNSTARTMLVSVLELEGDLRQAIDIVKEEYDLLDSSPKLKLLLVLLYYKNKNYEISIEYLNEILREWEGYPDARYILGLSYLQEEDFEQAKEQFIILQQAYPDHEELDQIIKYIEEEEAFEIINAQDKKINEVQRHLEKEQIQNQENLNNSLMFEKEY